MSGIWRKCYHCHSVISGQVYSFQWLVTARWTINIALSKWDEMTQPFNEQATVSPPIVTDGSNRTWQCWSHKGICHHFAWQNHYRQHVLPRSTHSANHCDSCTVLSASNFTNLAGSLGCHDFTRLVHISYPTLINIPYALCTVFARLKALLL